MKLRKLYFWLLSRFETKWLGTVVPSTKSLLFCDSAIDSVQLAVLIRASTYFF